MSEHYLSDQDYFRLVRRLAECGNDLERIKATLGEVGGVWPDSVRVDLERSDRLTAQARAQLSGNAA